MSRRFLSALILSAGVVVLAGWWWLSVGRDSWSAIRTAEPKGTEIHDSAGLLLAQLTDGARMVVLAGPARTSREPGVDATVTSDRWVRLLPSNYDGHVDDTLRSWLLAKLEDRSPDLFAIASEYFSGAPDIQADGLRIAGDATYELGADLTTTSASIGPTGPRPMSPSANTREPWIAPDSSASCSVIGWGCR